MNNENYNTILEFFSSNQVEIFGIADLHSIPELDKIIDDSIYDHIKNLRYAISFGLKLSGSILDTIIEQPNLLYAFHYRRVNESIDLIGVQMSNLLERKGFKAMPFPASQVLDYKKQKAHISHRHMAYYAGLGWFGRNNLLVNKKFGSQVRYATLLTDMPLPSNKPIEENCNSCKKCILTCPASAINESSKKFNGEACYKQLQTFSKMPGIYHLICGICISVCGGKKNGNN